MRSDCASSDLDRDLDGAADGASAPPAWLAQLVAAAVADESGPHDLDEQLRPPLDGSGRPAAVLIAFCDTPDGPGVLLTERAMTLRSHAGQAAFPGGGSEPGDLDAAATAVREATEEVGLQPATVRPLATLPDRFVPRSGYVVTPVIAWWAEPHPVAAIDAGEVARAVVVTVAELADPANRFTVAGPTGRWGPGFEIDGLFIWGFTAMLIDHLLSLGGWDRDWDRSTTRPLPVRRTW